MTFAVVLEVIAALIILKCVVLLAFTDRMRTFTLSLVKDKRKFRRTAWMYLLIGIALLIISLFLKSA